MARIEFPAEQAADVREIVKTLRDNRISMSNPLIGREHAILPLGSLISQPQADVQFTDRREVRLECFKDSTTSGVFVFPLNADEPLARVIGINRKQILFLSDEGWIRVFDDQVRSHGVLWCGNLLTLQLLLKLEIARTIQAWRTSRSWSILDRPNRNQPTLEIRSVERSDNDITLKSIRERLGERYDDVVEPWGY